MYRLVCAACILGAVSCPGGVAAETARLSALVPDYMERTSSSSLSHVLSMPSSKRKRSASGKLSSYTPASIPIN